MAVRKAKKKERYAIIANRSYGLYAGIVESATIQPDGTVVVEARECRHVCRWYGKSGGITSLAAFGLCGSSASQSRVAAPVRATLSGVVNIFDCTPEARKTLESAIQS